MMEHTQRKAILVTGGAGFIGSAFVRLALNEGCLVVVLDALTYSGLRENLAGIEKTGSLQFFHGDIQDTELVLKIIRQFEVQWVFNFAAESHVDRSIAAPACFVETNITGTFSLLRASLEYWKNLSGAARDRFRYVQISTDEVYGALGPTGQFSEESPLAPNSPYSASKAASDLLVRSWHHTYGLPTITTRCSNNYGPHQFPEKLIPLMILNCLELKPLPIYGDGLQVRDWIHVDDHCRGLWLAALSGLPGSVYCLGGQAERTNLEVVHFICDRLNEWRPRQDGKSYRDQKEGVTDRLGHDRRYAIDDSKAVRELGFSRQHSFDAGLCKTIKWYLENRDWVEIVRKKVETI